MHWPFQSCITRLQVVLRIVDKSEIEICVDEIEEEVCKIKDLSKGMSSRLTSAYTRIEISDCGL